MSSAQSVLEEQGFTVLEKIGQGRFGEVLKVKNKDEITCVTKVIKKSGFDLHEVDVLREMTHPFIVQYKDSFTDIGSENLYIVMEYCEAGDLSQKIEALKDAGGLFTEAEILSWFAELCAAVHHVHEKGILHRDIKPQNIFLDKHGTIRLGDFGLAKTLERSAGFVKTGAGTLPYLSPEIIEQQDYSSKSDMWALGCVLFELCELKLAVEVAVGAQSMNDPLNFQKDEVEVAVGAQSMNDPLNFQKDEFPEEKVKDVLCKIMVGPSPSISGDYSTDLQALVRDLLQKNPADRPSASDVLKRPFIVWSLLKKIDARPEETGDKLQELKEVADHLERANYYASGGMMVGVTTTVLGIMAPFTAGASLMVAGTLAAAGSAAGAVSYYTKVANERTDCGKIEEIIHEIEVMVLSVLTCLDLIIESLKVLAETDSIKDSGHQVVRRLRGLIELLPTIQKFRVRVKDLFAFQVVTDMFVALYQAFAMLFTAEAGVPSTGSEIAEDEERKKARTRTFVEEIRKVCERIQMWLDEYSPVHSAIIDRIELKRVK